jgi:hypothetical protein
MKTSLIVLLLFWLSACGVKGDPLPPERPVELGRGRPTYRRATEGIRIERKAHPPEKDDEDEKEDQDSDEN